MLSRGLAMLFACGLLVCTCQASAETPPEKVDLELFSSSEVDRSTGCSVVLWQHNRDPETAKYAYLFTEMLVGQEFTRQPARIKIGAVVKTCDWKQVVQTSGGATFSGEYKLRVKGADGVMTILEPHDGPAYVGIQTREAKSDSSL